MANIRSDFHVELAQLFYDDIVYQRSKYYYFLGKVDKWNAADETPTGILEDSLEENNKIRSNIVFAKRISPSDISLACRNYSWSLGLIFDRWDHTQDMYGKMFFCITDEYRVYKCLDNANGGESSIKPTGTSFAPIRLEDGYLWKYMYTIPSFKRPRFITVENIPVQRALTDNFFNRGELEGAIVTSKGSGYTTNLKTSIVINEVGKTTGSGASAVLTVGPIGNITGVVTSGPSALVGGSGYTKGAKIDITAGTVNAADLVPGNTYQILSLGTTDWNAVAGNLTPQTLVQYSVGYTITVVSAGTGTGQARQLSTGTGAVLEPIINGSGVITGVNVVNPGIGYSAGDQINFRVGGAVLIPKIDSTQSLAGVIIKDPGIGYVLPPTLTLVGEGGQGSGKFGTNTSAILKAQIDEGSIQLISIEDPGVNYPRGVDTTVTVQGDGSGATMSPVVYNGEIIDAILENPGSGYTFTIITVIGAGSGAKIESILDESDYESDQSIIEQTAVPGAIYAVGIENGGQGYSDNVELTIQGDGVGCTATCEVVAGQIVRTNVTSFGSGYSYAKVIVNDASGAGANLYAILPPPGGHGVNAPIELLGDTIVLNASLRTDLLDSGIEQDYRQFGIIKNPRDTISFANFTEENAIVTYTATFDDVSDLLVDEILEQGNNKFLVVKKGGVGVPTNTVVLVKLNASGNLTTEVPLTSVVVPGSGGARSYNCTFIQSSPNFNKYSGNMLYASNEAAFTFNQNQGIIIKTLIQF